MRVKRVRTGGRGTPLAGLTGAPLLLVLAAACSSPRSTLPTPTETPDAGGPAPTPAPPVADAAPPPADARTSTGDAPRDVPAPGAPDASGPPRPPDAADLAPPDPCQPVCRPELVARTAGDNELAPVMSYTLWNDELLYLDRTRGEIMAAQIARATTRTLATLDSKALHGLRLTGTTLKWLVDRPDGTQEISYMAPGATSFAVSARIPAGQNVSDFVVNDTALWISELGMATPVTRRYAIRTPATGGMIRTLYEAAVDVTSGGFIPGFIDYMPVFFFVNGPPGMVEIHRGEETGGLSRSLRRTSARVQLLGLVGDVLYWMEDDQELWRAPASGASPATLVTMAPRGRYRFGVYAGGRFYLFGDKQLAAVLHQDQVRLLVAPQPSGERAALGIDASHVLWLDDRGGLWRAKL